VGVFVTAGLMLATALYFSLVDPFLAPSSASSRRSSVGILLRDAYASAGAPHTPLRTPSVRPAPSSAPPPHAPPAPRAELPVSSLHKLPHLASAPTQRHPRTPPPQRHPRPRPRPRPHPHAHPLCTPRRILRLTVLGRSPRRGTPLSRRACCERVDGAGAVYKADRGLVLGALVLGVRLLPDLRPTRCCAGGPRGVGAREDYLRKLGFANYSANQSVSQSVGRSVSMPSKYLLTYASWGTSPRVPCLHPGPPVATRWRAGASATTNSGPTARRHAAQGANEDERIAPLQQLVVQREVHGLRAQRGGDHRSGQLCVLRQPNTGGCAPAGQGRGGGEAGALHRNGRHGLSGGRRPARPADLHRRRQEVHPRPACP
jgi:hypothetical protein